MTLQTEYEFTLPKGYVDAEGGLHREGRMRLATALDEIEPLRDPRVFDNEAYLTILMLARVITDLGQLGPATPEIVEGMFSADLVFLQDLYAAANFGTDEEVRAVLEPPRPTKAAAAKKPARGASRPASAASKRTPAKPAAARKPAAKGGSTAKTSAASKSAAKPAAKSAAKPATKATAARSRTAGRKAS